MIECVVKCDVCGEPCAWEVVPLYGLTQQRCRCGVRVIPRIPATEYVEPPLPHIDGLLFQPGVAAGADERECDVCGRVFIRWRSRRAISCSASCAAIRRHRRKRQRAASVRKQGSGVRCSVCGAARGNVRIDDTGRCARCRHSERYRARRLRKIAQREEANAVA